MENSDEKTDETIFAGGREPRFIRLDTAEEWLLKMCQLLKIDLPGDPADLFKGSLPEVGLDLDSVHGLATSQAVGMWVDLVCLREDLATGSDQEKLIKHRVMELSFAIANGYIALVQAAAAKASLDDQKKNKRKSRKKKTTSEEYFRKALVMGEWEPTLHSGVPQRAGNLYSKAVRAAKEQTKKDMQAAVEAEMAKGLLYTGATMAVAIANEGKRGWSEANVKKYTTNPNPRPRKKSPKK